MDNFVNDHIEKLKNYDPVESDDTLRSKYFLGAVSYTHLTLPTRS